MSSLPVIVSVHDVMPSTLGDVLEILRLLERHEVSPVDLLVVPGSGWDAAGLARLRELEQRGYRLAGHGWAHRVERIRGLRHRLHSAILSRDVAEHLALDRSGVLSLMERCHAWFGDQGFEPPRLYVPPAWAVGPVTLGDLAGTRFSWIETFGGLYDAENGRFLKLPLVGYEADSSIRVGALRIWNALNTALARPARPLRVSIHPGDLALGLAPSLRGLFERPLRVEDFRTALAPA